MTNRNRYRTEHSDKDQSRSIWINEFTHSDFSRIGMTWPVFRRFRTLKAISQQPSDQYLLWLDQSLIANLYLSDPNYCRMSVARYP